MTTGGVKVRLDEVRTLRYTTPAFYRLEEETGLTLGELQGRLSAGSVRAIVALVWAGLLHAEPRLTLENAAERVDMANLDGIAQAVGEAISKALGVGEEQDEGNVTPAA